MNKKVNHRQKKTIAERVKLRRQIADDEDLPEMLLLKVDEEVREGTGLKLLNSNKLLTILPMSLTQIKVGNNSCKLKNEIR